MKKLFVIFCMISLSLSGCGKLDQLKDISLKPNANLPIPSSLVTGPYSPGSYFIVYTELGTAKDTRIYELKYKTDGTFEVLQKNFAAGNMSTGYFQKTTGNYSETVSGSISHTVTYDSCGNMAPQGALFSGNPDDSVIVLFKGSTVKLYSAITWSIPQSLLSQVGTVTEDVGCTKFKNQ